MSLTEKLQRFLGTQKWRCAETERIVRLYFQDHDPVAAAAVVDCLQDMLGVNFDQLRPETNLVNDLGTDEEVEYVEIALALKENYGVTITPEQVYETKAVGELVTLVTRLLNEESGAH